MNSMINDVNRKKINDLIVASVIKKSRKYPGLWIWTTEGERIITIVIKEEEGKFLLNLYTGYTPQYISENYNDVLASRYGQIPASVGSLVTFLLVAEQNAEKAFACYW